MDELRPPAVQTSAQAAAQDDDNLSGSRAPGDLPVMKGRRIVDESRGTLTSQAWGGLPERAIAARVDSTTKSRNARTFAGGRWRDGSSTYSG